MKQLPVHAKFLINSGRTVYGIADDGAIDMFKVGADLVGAARDNFYFYKR